MRVLAVHNYYQQRGGEDISFGLENKLLKAKGNDVIYYTRNNDEIKDLGLGKLLPLFFNTIYSKQTYKEIRKIIQADKIDLIHVQNFFPLISPSVFYAAKQEGIPTVFSARNYRLLCPNGLFYRDGHACEDCLGKFFASPGILHRCYRNSSIDTLPVALMESYHRVRKTWNSSVECIIALSEFSRKKLIEGGIDPARIVVKPNYVDDPGPQEFVGDYVLFVGRLTKEKGIDLLLKAIKTLPDILFLIVGNGPSMEQVKNECIDNKNVQLLGSQNYTATIEYIKRARFLLFPTQLYETFGRVVIEANACGIPVIASKIGAVEELIQNEQTGLLFDYQNSDEFCSKVSWLWNHADECQRMGKKARSLYEEKYSPSSNYDQLMKIYQNTIAEFSRKK